MRRQLFKGCFVFFGRSVHIPKEKKELRACIIARTRARRFLCQKYQFDSSFLQILLLLT